MRKIVSNALAFQNCEAPSAAAPEARTRGTDKGCDTGGEGFAEKLKDFENESSAKLKPQDESGAKDKDTGMSDNPDCMVYGIVGILEGFEPPGYQAGKEAVITAGAVTAAAAESGLVTNGMTAAGYGEEAYKTAVSEGNVAEAAPQEDKGSLPEQVAWTLNSDEAGERLVRTQEQILQVVGDYLDSLENTSKAAKGDTLQNEAAQMSNSGITTDRLSEPSAQNGAAKQQAEADEGASPISFEPAADGEPRVTQETEKEQGNIKKAPEPVVTDFRNAAAKTDVPESVQTPAKSAQAYDAPKPESVRDSVMRIVDKVSTKAAEGRYDFDIDLKPDFMGKVSIKLTMEDGAVKVRIKADDPGVKGMILDQASSLQTMLKEKGINVSNIEVMHHDTGTAPGSEGQQRQDGGGRQEGGFYYEQADNGTYESARERYDFYLGNSSIEYLA